MDAALGLRETRSDFLREAVDGELDRRRQRWKREAIRKRDAARRLSDVPDAGGCL
jgi:Arc/MetJ-type ribon-helix-helix transcriptional regulator